jgi:hypothetical protein
LAFSLHQLLSHLLRSSGVTDARSQSILESAIGSARGHVLVVGRRVGSPMKSIHAVIHLG